MARYAAANAPYGRLVWQELLILRQAASMIHNAVGEFRIGLTPHRPKTALPVPLVDFVQLDLDFQSGLG
jgi:hypothetical protein